MQYNTKINGCNTRSYSRKKKKCRNCDKKEYCEYKKLEKLPAVVLGETTAGEKNYFDNAVRIVGQTAAEVAEAMGMAEQAMKGVPMSASEVAGKLALGMVAGKDVKG